jgi:hypothetical protein
LAEAAGVRRFTPTARRPEKVSPAARCGDSRLERNMASTRRPRAATGSKKGGALEPQGAPYGEAAARLARAARTPALRSPSAHVGTCMTVSHKGSGLEKMEGGSVGGNRRRQGGLRVRASALPTRMDKEESPTASSGLGRPEARPRGAWACVCGAG